jgi:fermentation-respiration switch protein FrsA (DUF1100 family)
MTPVPPVSVPTRKPRSWRRWLLRGAAVLGSAYVGVILLLMAFEDRLAYHPIPADVDWTPAPSAEFQDVDLRAADGTSIHAWWLPREGASGAILCCHGNAGNLSYCGQLLVELREALRESVLVFDYPGYGRSGGRPSEAGCFAAADAAYDWLTQTRHVPPDGVLLYGESLGGGVVVDLASRRPHRGLVLARTFTSLPDVGQHHLPWLPVHWMTRNRFDSLAKIRLCRGPVFVVHGTADWLVPFTQGQRLFEAANEPKAFCPVEGAGHNDIPDQAFLSDLRRFLAEHPASPANPGPP